MYISVIDPIEKAFRRTKTTLFAPFSLGKWFSLGFCAFLATLGEGGGGCANFNYPFGGGGGRPGPGAPGTPGPAEWIESNLYWLVPAGLAVLLVAVAVGAVIVWLSSRGRFMFLDGLVHNRGWVGEPWREFRGRGNSLFVFRFWVGLASFFGILTFAALGLAAAWPDIQARQFGANAVTAILVGGLLLTVWTVAFLILFILLNDFVVPAMYLRDVGVMEGWRVARAEIFRGHVGTIVLFYLMRIVLGLAIGVVATIVVCLTCCVASLPYIGTVVLLPLIVFDRCYALYFIEQFGPQWLFFRDLPRYSCPGCGYDLRGNVTGVCSECGMSIPEGVVVRPAAPDAGPPPPPQPPA